MGFFQKIGDAFGMRPLDTVDGMTPEQRIKLKIKKESDTSLKDALKMGQRLIESTESANWKVSQLKHVDSFIKLRNEQPLEWINLALAIYDRGHPIFDEDLGSHMRDALAKVKSELAPGNQKDGKLPDEKKQKFFLALEKDIEKRHLTSLKFLHETKPTESVPQTVTMQDAFKAENDGRPPVAANDNFSQDKKEEKEKHDHKKKAA